MTEFTKKYITKYYIFGYCCIAGFGLQTFFYFLNYWFMPQPFKLIMFILLNIGSVLLFMKWLTLTIMTPKKKRFYTLGKAMLDKGEYKERFFLNGMYDPCYRIIAKDLLYAHGMEKEYKDLKTLKKNNKIMFIDENYEQIFGKKS